MRKLLLLLTFPFIAHAHDHHPANTVTEVTQVNKGIGLAATGHHFDYGTLNLQWSFAASQYDGDSSLSYAMALRPCDKCPLVNGSITTDKDKTGLVVGVGGRF